MSQVGAGSVFGGSLLIAGSCIGAGMLALPVQTGVIGFVPFLVMFISCWLFMTCTGLLLLEVNLWCGETVSIVTMAERTLGRIGKIISWLTFCFLFYSLMVAYIAGSRMIVVDALTSFISIDCPDWVIALVVTVFFGALVYCGAGVVDRVNRVFMAALIVVYFALVFIGITHVKGSLLSYHYWPKALFVLPIMVVMFGYHNLVPSLTMYLRGDSKRLIRTIIIGSTISFVVCLLWEWVILGIVPMEGEHGLMASTNRGDLATRALQYFVGVGWVSSAAQAFALCAIVTSCFGVALSFVDFLADGLHVPRKSRRGMLALCFAVMVPAFVFSLVSPRVFFTALNYAGGFAAVILFGIFPALMVWVGRYRRKNSMLNILPGGRFMLVLVMLVAGGIFCLELFQEFFS